MDKNLTELAGMADQVRDAVDKANNRLYGKRAALHFRDSQPPKTQEEKIAVCNGLKKKVKLAPRARFELATRRLTAECSTIELPGNWCEQTVDHLTTAVCVAQPSRRGATSAFACLSRPGTSYLLSKWWAEICARIFAHVGDNSELDCARGRGVVDVWRLPESLLFAPVGYLI